MTWHAQSSPGDSAASYERWLALVELAHAGRRDEFNFLARASGMDPTDYLWRDAAEYQEWP